MCCSSSRSDASRGPDDAMRCLVIGAGSIGQRHCRNLVALGHQVSAWDPVLARLDEVTSVPGVQAAAGLESAFAQAPEAALVCTPPAAHARHAMMALDAGAHVFVEKPISDAVEPAERLVAEAQRRGRVLAVGFNLRFLPSLQQVRALLDGKRAGRVLSVRAEFGAYLPDWRPGRDYRDNYAVDAALGGGILLDAIHELDYLGWLFGDAQEVFCAAGHVSALAGDTEDVAEVTIRLQTGLLAQVHLDYVQRASRRNLQVIGEDATIVWDYPTHTVTLTGGDGRPEVTAVADGEANTMYMDELRHFAECVAQGSAPAVNGAEALRSLRLVEAAKRSARCGRWVTVR
jgi:predicted dehydrogenase